MGELKASPRNSLLGLFSDTLRPVRDFGDKAHIPDWVPLLGGSGIGELLMGKSPELLDDLSYNLSSGIRGGNAATGGLGTLTLDKRSADLGMTAADVAGLSAFALRKALKNSLTDTVKESRRQFMFGKNEGLGKATPESLVDTSKPIADGIDAVSSIPVDRRTFLKGAAAAGAAASLPTMLRKFGKEGGETAAKAAEHTVDNIATNATKYKYNSLKEYLDDVETQAFSKFDEPHTAGWDIGPNDLMRERLLQDEAKYSSAKNRLRPEYKKNSNTMFDDIDPGSDQRLLDSFSPQAKQEMKALKSLQGNDWVHEIQSPEFRYYLDNSGIIRGKPQYRGDHTLPSNEFYWNGKTPMDTQYEHLNPKTGGFNFWDETGGHGLSEGTNTLEELQRILKNYNP